MVTFLNYFRKSMKPKDSVSLSTHTDIDFSGSGQKSPPAGRLDNLENQNQNGVKGSETNFILETSSSVTYWR